MKPPFSTAQFVDLFAAYNQAVWPAQWVLSLIAIALLVLTLRPSRHTGRWLAGGMAVLWAWTAITYHVFFFWQINPAAPLFAALALLAAALFAWLGVIKNRLRIVTGMPCRRALGLAVAMFAVAIYPALGGLSGHTYPATPTFGLPCPVTIFTFGVTHMASNDLPKGLLLVPLLWAVIGSMAAWTLGVVQDFTLVVVAVLGTCQLFRTRRARHNP